MDRRKQAVSIRMSASDVRKVKGLAERLGVRDSDIIRFAVKTMLSKLAPLHDPMVRGGGLLPVFLESGSELFHHFDLDALRLESIINQDVDEGSRVEHDDIQLIAMSGTRHSYMHWSLDKRPAPSARAGSGPNGRHDTNGGPGNGHAVEARDEPAGDDPAVTLRHYLYDKYQHRDGGGA